MANRTVSVSLVADVGGYVSGMQKAATATKSVGDTATESGGRIRSGFDTAGRGATVLGGLLAGGVALGIKSVIGAASDLNETLNKSNVIFGSNSAQIERWAQGAAKNVGLSQSAALDAASSFGNMFQQLGFVGDQAASMSTNVVQLAADLGSFNNLETGDVLERIQGALRGEYDSLQLLIPNINAARVEQEALAETGKQNAAELTAQEKATATLAIVQRDGSAAANDFAETSGGLANSTKIAAAQFEDLKTEIGQAFLPVAQEAMHFLSDTAIPAISDTFGAVMDLAKAFGDLPGPVQIALLAAAGWATLGGKITQVWGGVTDKIKGFREQQELQRALFSQQSNGLSDVDRALGGLGTSLDTTSSKFGTAKAAIGGFASAVGPELGVALVAGGISLLVNDLDKITNAGGDAQEQIDEITKSLDKMGNAGRIDATSASVDRLRDSLEQTQSILTQGVGDQGFIANLLGPSAVIAGQAASMTDASAAAELLRDKIAELEIKQQNASDTADVLTGRIGLNRDQVIQLADKYNIDLSQGLDAVYGRMLLARDAEDAVTGSGEAASSTMAVFSGHMDEVAAAADAAKNATDQFQLSLDTLTGKQVGLNEVESAYFAALDSAKGALDGLNGQVVTAAGNLDLSTEAGRKTNDILTNLASTGNEYIATLVQQGATSEQANAKDAELRQSFYDTALQMTGSATAAENLTNQIFGIPDQRTTQINADVQAAQNAIANTQHMIDSMHGKTVNITVTATGGLAAVLGDPNVGRTVGTAIGFAGGGYTGDGGRYTPAGIVHAGEVVWSQDDVAAHGGPQRVDAMRKRRGYADGGIVIDIDNRPATATISGLLKHLEPVTGYIGALNWAKAQSGKPYVWGAAGPGAYDCSGFMSAITRVIRGQSVGPRVGATANFPWAGFAPGNNGLFNIGSTKNAGGGIGHMAGDILGVNVESTGDHVRYGAAARGSSNGLFNTRAHLAMANGGVIGEPVFGMGAWSGNSYSFAERGDEVVLPRGRESSGGVGWGSGGGAVSVSIEGAQIVGTLDLGGGLEARIDGRIVGALATATTRSRNNTR